MTLPQFWCWLLWRHDATLQIDNRSIAMRCTSCGYVTPGWQVEGKYR